MSKWDYDLHEILADGSSMRGLKLWKQSPAPGTEALFRSQFNRVFGQRTGYKNLDALLGITVLARL